MVVDTPFSSSSSSSSTQAASQGMCGQERGAVAHPRPQNTHRNIPLPADLLAGREGSQHADDPQQHQGRLRSFPHERGNWASILYIPLHLGIYGPSFSSLVSSLVSTCRQHNLSLTPSADLHVSLSRTLVLQLHWIHPLTEDLRRALVHKARFSLWLHGLSVYVNEEQTRTFLGLRVCQGRAELDNLVADADKCFSEYRLPPFYKDGSYHASIAWCVGDVSEPLRRLLPQLENLCSQYFAVETDMRTFDISTLLFKTGHRLHTLHLRSQD